MAKLEAEKAPLLQRLKDLEEIQRLKRAAVIKEAEWLEATSSYQLVSLFFLSLRGDESVQYFMTNSKFHQSRSTKIMFFLSIVLYAFDN